MTRYHIPQQEKTPFFIGPEETDRACLLVHGFMGTPLDVRSLGQALAAQGILTYHIVVAGHTGDTEKLLHTSHKDWIASAEAGLAQLAGYSHVFIAGLSMGGALALVVASRHPDRVAGVIAMSSLTRLSPAGWPAMLVPLIPPAHRFITWFYPLALANFKNPKLQRALLKQAHSRDPQITTIDFSDPQINAFIRKTVRIPIPALNELIELTKEERKSLSAVRVPLLIIHSKRDRVVRPACADELFRLATAASPKSLHWLEQSDHVITVGPGCQQVCKLALSFIETTIRDRESALPTSIP